MGSKFEHNKKRELILSKLFFCLSASATSTIHKLSIDVDPERVMLKELSWIEYLQNFHNSDDNFEKNVFRNNLT